MAGGELGGSSGVVKKHPAVEPPVIESGQATQLLCLSDNCTFTMAMANVIAEAWPGDLVEGDVERAMSPGCGSHGDRAGAQ